MSYKKLGDYIQVVDIRNTDLSVTKLLGVSVKKVYIDSIANTVGTDFRKYKVVRKYQFTYIPDTSRRGDKIGIAMLEGYDVAIVSQAYTVFEIIDSNELNPEYLMMWFKRPEFDRYARYKSHGSVREIMDFQEMGEVELPIPSIEKQKAIVKEYNTVVNRIKLNETINQKLEETAQALYKHWFVDFEFPNEDGEPYKSSGGEMVYCEELDKEIPVGWEVDRLGNLTNVGAGGDKPKLFSPFKTEIYNIPIYSNSSNNNGLYGFTKTAKITAKSITISARGAIIGFTRLRMNPFFPIVRLIVITPTNRYRLSYLFFCIDDIEFDSAASAQGQLTVPEISFFEILNPTIEVLIKFHSIYLKIWKNINLNEIKNEKLIQLTEIVLSKMTKIHEILEIEDQ